MARIVDTSKLENVKQEAMKLIVEKGYGGASTSNIAKRAKVAEGYLYRFYSSKSELVSDLLNSKITLLADLLEDSIQHDKTFEEILELFIRALFRFAEELPIEVKFLYVMMNDYTFSVESKIKERISVLCNEVNQKGHRDNVFATNIGIEEIYLLSVIYPIQFINLRLKNFFGKTCLDESDIKRVIEICTKTIKK